MTPPARRDAALDLAPSRLRELSHRELAESAWQQAVEVRRAWHDRGLATEPADRAAAEQSLTNIYARLGRPRPRFEWVDSPHKALRIVADFPTHDVLYQWISARSTAAKPPFASDLAAGLSRLRSSLDESIAPASFGRTAPKRKPHEPWPVLASRDALEAGVPFLEILRQGVRTALRTSLADGFYLPVRATLAESQPLPVSWYGQQESYWIAYYDVCRRLALAQYPRRDDDHLGDWSTLAGSCGWWWSTEDTCVIVERPAVVHTEPVPGAWHGQVRLHHGRGPAIEYRDGWYPRLR